jgi:hypothetical protein
LGSGPKAQKDGAPPIDIASFNAGPSGKRVTAVTGVLDEGLAACIEALLEHPDVPKLPESAEPRADNQRALDVIRNVASPDAPAPFIAAMVVQESGGQHFHVPGPRDTDAFITVGLDRNDPAEPDRITSRGYGLGQYTLFHHPPRAAEVDAVMLDPAQNASAAFRELREKFTTFVVGPADSADDRKNEHPLLPLRECRYPRADSRFMRDCKACAAGVRKIAIRAGTPVFAGAQRGVVRARVRAFIDSAAAGRALAVVRAGTQLFGGADRCAARRLECAVVQSGGEHGGEAAE